MWYVMDYTTQGRRWTLGIIYAVQERGKRSSTLTADENIIIVQTINDL